jgi:hypothetical protein
MTQPRESHAGWGGIGRGWASAAVALAVNKIASTGMVRRMAANVTQGRIGPPWLDRRSASRSTYVRVKN